MVLCRYVESDQGRQEVEEVARYPSGGGMKRDNGRYASSCMLYNTGPWLYFLSLLLL
jgi:hypothetical protein